MSANEFFEEYGRDGIGKGADKWMIRRQLIDAFQKEMFGLVKLRTKNLDPDSPEITEVLRSVTSETQKKWVKLCKIFSQYKETRDLLKIDDLTHGELEGEAN